MYKPKEPCKHIYRTTHIVVLKRQICKKCSRIRHLNKDKEEVTVRFV